MTYTPIPKGTTNWDVPLNAALSQLDATITANNSDALQAANNLSDLTSAAQARTNLGISNTAVSGAVWVNVRDYGAVGNNTADDTAAIQAAINACPVDGVVLFPIGKYRTTSPLLLPPGVTLQGELDQRRPRNNWMGYPNLGDAAYISPRSTFTGAAVILVNDALTGGYSTMAQGSAISHLRLSCSALPVGSNVDGVQVFGQVQGLVLDNVSVVGSSGYGFNFARNTAVTAGPNNPFSLRVINCYVGGGGTATTPGGYFLYNCTDSSFIDCEVIGVGGDGWTIQGGGNTHFIGCRSENNAGNGFTLTQTAAASGAISHMVGCSSSSNALNGYNIVNVQQATLTSCVSAGGEGATNASFYLNSATGITSLNNCTSVVGGTSQYGVNVVNNLNAVINGGTFYGSSNGFHDGGGNTRIYKSANVIELAGSTTTPTVTVNGVQEGTGGLGIGQAAGGGNTLKITSGTSPTVGITGTANGQQLILATGNDNTSPAYQANVTGDSVNRYRVLTDGTTTWGPGGAGSRDTTLGRSANGVLYTDKNLLVGSATALGDNGVGEIQLAYAATPPSTNPTNGVDIYAFNNNIPLRVRDTSGNIRGLLDVAVIAASDQSTTGSAQAASTQLTVPVEIGATYLVELSAIISWNNATAGNGTFSWTGPTGATMKWGDVYTPTDYQSTLGGVISIANAATTRFVVFKGKLVTGANAGNLVFTFGSSNATTQVSVLTDSTISLRRIK